MIDTGGIDVHLALAVGEGRRRSGSLRNGYGIAENGLGWGGSAFDASADGEGEEVVGSRRREAVSM
ncbi:hypothetical protein ACWGDT_35965 [Streptomyces avermitilis]